MNEINSITKAVTKGTNVVRISDIQRNTITREDSLTTVDGNKLDTGEYVFARLDILIPIQEKP